MITTISRNVGNHVITVVYITENQLTKTDPQSDLKFSENLSQLCFSFCLIS